MSKEAKGAGGTTKGDYEHMDILDGTGNFLYRDHIGLHARKARGKEVKHLHIFLIAILCACGGSYSDDHPAPTYKPRMK